ncbi:hypothetical protein [Paracidovorax valerianellae]|uniref:hypothetical protein n=1 Tax=Paracidovorax valerianellae TaxID=187868 RepID=UPI003EC07758
MPSVEVLAIVMALPREDVTETVLPPMAAPPLSFTLTAKLVVAPVSRDEEPDAVKVVPVTGMVMDFVIDPDFTVTAMSRLERSVPAVNTAVALPSAAVVLTTLANVPLEAVNDTVCAASALLAASFTTAVNVRPVLSADAKPVAEVNISTEAAVLTGVVPPGVVPALPPPPPQATKVAASDRAMILMNDFIIYL